jgi:hypothetical protein
MKRRPAWQRLIALPLLLLAALGGTSHGETTPSTGPGRLFYTPEQRAQLEAARTRNVTQAGPARPEAGPAPVRFDGIVIRSDGSGTRWVNGRPQTGTAGVADLKPGQIRADGRVYEPYQVLRPGPEPATAKEASP